MQHPWFIKEAINHSGCLKGLLQKGQASLKGSKDDWIFMMKPKRKVEKMLKLENLYNLLYNYGELDHDYNCYSKCVCNQK